MRTPLHIALQDQAPALSRRSIAREAILDHPAERFQIFGMLGVLFFTLALLYAYFVSAAALATIERSGAEKSSRQLLTDIAGLESEYLRAVSVLDLSAAYKRGFVEAEDQSFVSRHSGALSFAPNGFRPR